MFYRKNSGGVLENVTVNSSSFADSMYAKIAQTAFDAAHPVGELYVQYPGQKNPNDLYNSDLVECTWTDVSSDYAGRFFRVAGGNAAAFSESSTSGSNQGQGTAKNGLTISKGGNGSSRSTGGMSGNSSGSITMQQNRSIVENSSALSGVFSVGSYGATSSGYETRNNWVSQINMNIAHTHSISDANIAAAIYVTLGNGDTETRPINATCKVWKRSA